MASACTLGKITAYCGLTPSRRIIRVTMPSPPLPPLSLPTPDIIPAAMEVYRVREIITFYLDSRESSETNVDAANVVSPLLT